MHHKNYAHTFYDDVFAYANAQFVYFVSECDSVESIESENIIMYHEYIIDFIVRVICADQFIQFDIRHAHGTTTAQVLHDKQLIYVLSQNDRLRLIKC